VVIKIYYTCVIKYLYFFVDNDTMNGMTVNEIGIILGINPKAAKMRLRKAGIKPISYAGPTAIYDPVCVDRIREVSKGGRPRKPGQPSQGTTHGD
jgi:hypothetical protein